MCGGRCFVLARGFGVKLIQKSTRIKSDESDMSRRSLKKHKQSKQVFCKCGRGRFCVELTKSQIWLYGNSFYRATKTQQQQQLCRLCECPASDGGVRVDQLNAAKLSEWWRCTIGVEYEADETSDTKEIICNFCVLDAR